MISLRFNYANKDYYMEIRGDNHLRRVSCLGGYAEIKLADNYTLTIWSYNNGGRQNHNIEIFDNIEIKYDCYYNRLLNIKGMEFIENY